MEGMIAPWVFLVLTGLWFGFLGYKTDGRWIRWSVGGALFALTASTIVIGLCDAAFIPLSHQEEAMIKIKTLILASLPILLVGACITLMLWRSGRLQTGKSVAPI